ncbi:MAG: hypothetical protein MK171_02745 [Pirellulales bacterium]|nr:hypothetical protein [Pirellulales bacterium]
MSRVLNEAAAWSGAGEAPESISLDLHVSDADSLRALAKYEAGPQRDEFALEALKIGVLALRHAAGALDADFVQRETTRLVDTLRSQLDEHAHRAHDRLTGSLKEYFDPEGGRFSQRVQCLVADDGDLARLLSGILDGDDSRLAKTLFRHVGENSPLMKLLSPDQSQGLLATLRISVEGQLTQQRERILKEFSLDNPDGAIRRLVGEITSKHGDFTKNMEGKIDEVAKQFSLDEENSALSRLVNNVDEAQKKITQEFSLDNKQSALHKLKEELLSLFSAQVKTNADFQEEVKIALGKLVTKRETEAQGTQHGFSFEDALFEIIERDALQRGEVAEKTGNQSGLISRSKKGDIVLELGSDSAAAGARIVVEAKQDASYKLAKALAEMEEARKNRDAQFGVFVFSRRAAPNQLAPLARYGSDLVVVWDAEDPTTDSTLRAALEIARALCVRSCQAGQRQAADVDKAVLRIEKAVQNLDGVRTSAQTIKTASEKILDRVEKDQRTLDKQLVILRESLSDLKQFLGSKDSIAAKDRGDSDGKRPMSYRAN